MLSATSVVAAISPPGKQVARDVNSIERFKAQCEKWARMSLQLQTEEMPDYLAARFTGPGVAQGVWRQYTALAERCKRANKNKLLLDFTFPLDGCSIHSRRLGWRGNRDRM
jgi:hypothetical protein